MRTVPSNIAALLATRSGLKVRNLFWITARNRGTGAPETIGIWNGEDTETFTVDGSSRTYIGGGGFIQFDELKQETGLVINRLVARASPIAPEMDEVIRTYDSRFARVEIHEIFFDPSTNEQLDDPIRVFKGWINDLDLKTAAKNESGSITINMVGHSRILTRVNPTKRSDASQKKRLSTDRFYENVSMTGTISTPWGSY